MRSGPPTNVILIISDTFRYDCVTGVFAVKGQRASVPNLDMLRGESASFDRAYTASFPTVPNRHDLLTGKYTFTYSDWEPLPAHETVLPEMLREAGYVSAMIADTPHIFNDGFHYDKGFDSWQWIRGQENDRYRTSPQKVDLPCQPEKLRSVESIAQHMRNNALRTVEEDWIPARTSKAATDWLDQNYARKPFFLYVDFFDPHEPWDPPKRYVDMYDAGYGGEEVTYPAYGPCEYLARDELEHCRAMYAGEATLVDRWIGRLIEKVGSLGLQEDTAIIFVSDHGFYFGEHGLIGKSIIMQDFQGLAPLYEEVAHIPLLVRLPDVLGEGGGSKINALVQPPDITATILELAGIDYSKRGMQGESLIPHMSGSKKGIRKFAVSSPSIMHGIKAGLRVTLTTSDWSLILAPEGAASLPDETELTLIVDGVQRVLKPYGKIDSELYNLLVDPAQQYEVLSENLGLASELQEEFVNWLRRIGTREEYVIPWLKCKGLQ